MSDAGTRPTVPLDELARCSRTALPVDPWGKQVARPSALRQQNWDIGCRYWVGFARSHDKEAAVEVANVQRQLKLALPPFVSAPVAALNDSFMTVSVSRPSDGDRRLTPHRDR